MVVSTLLSTTAVAEEPTPGSNTEILERILTPGTVETKLVNLALAEQALNTI